jgi:hypothetical protein
MVSVEELRLVGQVLPALRLAVEERFLLVK